ncbi:hypothetical protein KAW65_03045 [candidate division WOR-3 bacterium]|nr:hypothetical protein [candidate division WOR-3 bacterium]
MKMQIEKCKMKVFLYCLLPTVYLLLLAGCGKKQPIGYEIIKSREGEIKKATGQVNTFSTYSEFTSTFHSSYLYVGDEGNFKAMAFLEFKPESLHPDSLFLIRAEGSGKIRVCKVTEHWDTDSLNWSNFPDTSEVFDTLTIGENDTCSIFISDIVSDSFSIGLLPEEGMISFYASWTTREPWLSVVSDTDTIIITPEKDAYIDTSYFSLPDSLTMIQTGAYVTQCTLYFYPLYPSILDSATAIIDSLPKSDSTKEVAATQTLEEATVNSAILSIPIIIDSSYNQAIEITSTYNSTSCSADITEEDTLVKIDIRPIVQKWFESGEKLWIVLKGSTEKISRVVLKPYSAELSIIYTLPPEER